MKYFAFAFAICVALRASRAESQTFTTLLSFTGSGGAAPGTLPRGSLTLIGTSLYGMAEGGTTGDGNIFSLGTNGTNYQTVVTFTGTGGTASGLDPFNSLTLAGTTFYGMTWEGGAEGHGNIFSVGTNGTDYENLVSFTGTGGTASGALPWGDLTLAGTTLFGMTFNGGSGNGNVFSVGTNGTDYQDLVSFTGSGSGGSMSGKEPQGSLALAGTMLYGMTLLGGANGYGNIFCVGTNGSNYQNLVSFTGTGGTATGLYPNASLIASGGTFYGMTGGAFADYGNVFSVGTNGTNYQELVCFTGSGSGGTANGSYPVGSLILSGTRLYGMTYEGGADGLGNIFGVGIDGSDYENLYSFAGGTDGQWPRGDLTLSDGTLFGTTFDGGVNPFPNGYGTVFALTLPAPTPEPDTLALSGSAAAVLVAYGWRRRRRRRRPVGGGWQAEAVAWCAKSGP